MVEYRQHLSPEKANSQKEKRKLYMQEYRKRQREMCQQTVCIQLEKEVEEKAEISHGKKQETSNRVPENQQVK